MWISKEKYEDIERRVQKLNEELLRLSKMTYLVDIKTEGIKMVLSAIKINSLPSKPYESSPAKKIHLLLKIRMIIKTCYLRFN